MTKLVFVCGVGLINSFFFLLFACFTIVPARSAETKPQPTTVASFQNYRLVRLHLDRVEHLTLIEKWADSDDANFDVWNDFRGLHRPVDVLISPKAYAKYKRLFDKHHMAHVLINADIQKSIDKERTRTSTQRGHHRDDDKQHKTKQKNTSSSSGGSSKTRRRSRRFVFEDIVGTFASYSQILNFISELVFFNPLYVYNYSIGHTYEKRDLQVLKIKTPTAKRKVWIDCGIHAREWISISTCVYLMDKLITDYNNNNELTVQLLDEFEVHILPVFNPDGYEYSFKHNRMWRKNRNPNNGRCHGVDLNRNFGFHWLSSGSSGTPCSEIYAGRSANSEPEVKAVQRALMSKSNWQVYLTFHSYGNFWFTPWGYTFKLPHDYHDLALKAQCAVDALKKVNGSLFTVGSSANLLYRSSGGSEDWAKGVAGIKYSYCVELGPQDDSNMNGFIVPESHIPTSGEEVYQAVRALLRSVLFKY